MDNSTYPLTLYPSPSGERGGAGDELYTRLDKIAILCYDQKSQNVAFCPFFGRLLNKRFTLTLKEEKEFCHGKSMDIGSLLPGVRVYRAL